MKALNFQYVQTIVKDRSAIVLDSGKEYLVEARLAPLVREFQLKDVDDLIIKSRTSTTLLRAILDAMTTNETSFFRDNSPFKFLEQHLFPQIIKQKEKSRTLNIWSAACSFGQEPYTLGMILNSKFPQTSTWRVNILATDISPTAIERAKKGEYSQLEVNRGLPAQMLIKNFARQGTRWKIKPEVQGRINFRLLNLARAWPLLPKMDLILLRNVMIYFDQDTKKSIVGRMEKALAPGGALILGSTETTMNLGSSLVRKQEGRAVYYQHP